MYLIKNSQIALIERDISAEDITYSHLRDELIDHVCCDIEHLIEKGMDFEQAYNSVKVRFGIHGIKKIQEDTVSLINFKYNIMKKVMRFSALLGPTLMAVGSLWKIMHWPMGSFLLLAGTFITAFLFFPAAMYTLYAEQKKSNTIFQYISGFIAGFLIVLFVLFKTMHWPGANILYVIGAAVGFLVFLPVVLINAKKTIQKGKKAYSISGILGVFIFNAGMLFKVFHWPGAIKLFMLGGIVIVGVALPLYAKFEMKQHKGVSSNFIFAVVGLFYLILFESLISINVKKDLLEVPAQIEHRTSQFNDYLTYKNNSMQSALLHDSLVAENHKEAINVIAKQSDNLMNQIEDLKMKIAIYCNSENELPLGPDNTLNSPKLDNKSDNSASEYLLSGEEKPALKLKKHIQILKNDMIRLSLHEDKTNIFKKLLNTDGPENEEKSWEEQYFQNVPLIFTLQSLIDIQQNIRLAENTFYSQYVTSKKQIK